MANIDFIYGQMTDTEKNKRINAMSTNELRSISEQDIKHILLDLDNKMRWGQSEETYNHWNAWVEGFELYNNKLFVDIYVQGSSTDENFSEYFSSFNKSTYRGKSDMHGFNVQFDEDEVAAAIRKLLKEYVRIKWTDKAKIERGKLVAQLTSYKVINPVVNAYYDEYNLRHSLNKYSDRYDVAKHKAYYHAEGKLDEYITDNADELLGKSEQELIAIYKEKFYDYAREFRNNFTDADFREWRSKQWFF